MANQKYAKYYEKYFGIEIPDGFVIHHIDSNRQNNHIDNLLMIPNELHNRYHCKNASSAWAFKGYGEVMEECKKYILLKQQLEFAKYCEGVISNEMV